MQTEMQICSAVLCVRVNLIPFLGFPVIADRLPTVQGLWCLISPFPWLGMSDLRNIPGISNPTHTKCFSLLKEEVGCFCDFCGLGKRTDHFSPPSRALWICCHASWRCWLCEWLVETNSPKSCHLLNQPRSIRMSNPLWEWRGAEAQALISAPQMLVLSRGFSCNVQMWLPSCMCLQRKAQLSFTK